MRDAFIEELVSQARERSNLALVVGDLGYSVIEPFADEFPERFVNVGVAEQNLTSVAAGMASEGYHVFTYSIANFPTFRCAEQLRNDVDYHNLPVTVVAVGGGVAYGSLGYSHHAVQDYALLRTMPNMLIASPGDPLEVRSCVNYLVSNPGPSYLRLGKSGEHVFHKAAPVLEPGRWLLVKEGDNKRILLTTGGGLQIAMEWLARPELSDWSVYSLPLWSMRLKPIQVDRLRAADVVITFEDHLHDGGFGSWLLEARATELANQTVIRPVALGSEVCGMVGAQGLLNGHCNFC